MSRKADHLWDIRQLKKPLTPPPPCPRSKFSTHNPGNYVFPSFRFRCLLPYRHAYTLSGPSLNLWVEGCVISSVSLRGAPGTSEHPTHTPQREDSEGPRLKGLGDKEQAEKGLTRPGQSKHWSPPALGIRMACPPPFLPKPQKPPRGFPDLAVGTPPGPPGLPEEGKVGLSTSLSKLMGPASASRSLQMQWFPSFHLPGSGPQHQGRGAALAQIVICVMHAVAQVTCPHAWAVLSPHPTTRATSG